MTSENLHAELDSIIERKNLLKFKIKTRDGLQEYVKINSTISYCLNSLKPDYREIIVETYINPDYRFWWIDKYCKSSYYRKRIKAISSFVTLFNLIYENYKHFSYNICHSIY